MKTKKKSIHKIALINYVQVIPLLLKRLRFRRKIYGENTSRETNRNRHLLFFY
jgi:hypothetical protein